MITLDQSTTAGHYLEVPQHRDEESYQTGGDDYLNRRSLPLGVSLARGSQIRYPEEVDEMARFNG